MINLVQKYVLGAFVASTLALTAYGYYLSVENEILSDKVAMLSLQKDIAVRRLNKAEIEQRDYYLKYANLNKEKQILEVELKQRNIQLENYKGREHVAVKKPKSIERLANRATSKLFSAYACTTSKSRACQDSKD